MWFILGSEAEAAGVWVQSDLEAALSALGRAAQS